MSPSSPLHGPYRLSFGPDSTLKLFATHIPAGFPSPAEDYLMRVLDLNEYLLKPPESTFGFIVKGESLTDINIHTDDVVIVKTEARRRLGQIVIAGINNEWVMKVLGEVDKMPCLLSRNSAYKPIMVKEYDDFRIFGVVSSCVHKFRE